MSKVGGPKAVRTRSLPNQLRHGWECMLRKTGSSLMHQPTPYPCTSPQSLHEMNLGLVNESWRVIGLPVTARDRILRCSPSVVGTTRAGPGLDSFQKDEGTEVTNSPSHLGRKTNRHLDVIQPFPFSLGKNGEVHPNPPMKK